MNKSFLILFTIPFLICCRNEQKSSYLIQKQQDSLLQETIYLPNQFLIKKDSLKGNYQLVYTSEDSIKRVYLQQDTNYYLLKTISSVDGSFHLLGMLLKDYDSSFILGHDNGIQTSYSIELINKETHKNIFDSPVTLINGHYPDKYIVYYDRNTPSLKNKIILYHTNTKKKETIHLDQYILPHIEHYNFFHFKIDSITKNDINYTYKLDSLWRSMLTLRQPS